MNNCWYCPHKWQCYDRIMKGRTKPCNNKDEQIKNWKWFDLYAETPEERQKAKEDYIKFCKTIDKHKVM